MSICFFRQNVYKNKDNRNIIWRTPLFFMRKINKEIQNIITEYKKFMNITYFPDVMVQYDFLSKKEFAYVQTDTLRTSKVILYYTSLYKKLDYPTRIIKIFHELTHIYDANFIFSEIHDKKIFSHAMTIFSEFHADQIATMKLCGKHNITDKNNIDLSYNVTYKKRIQTIKSYVEFWANQSVLYMKEDKKFWLKHHNNVILYVSIILKYLMYFLGQLSCLNLCNEDTINFNFDIYGDYDNDVYTLYSLLCKFDLNRNNDNLESLISFYTDFQMRLCKHYCRLPFEL